MPRIDVAWVAVPCDLASHPFTLRLRRYLDDPRGEVFVVRLWAWAKRYVPNDGSLRGFDADELEGACGWDGARGALLRALTDAGWLSDGGRVLYGWHDLNGWLNEKGAKERKRKRADYARKQGQRQQTSTVGRSVGRLVGSTESPRRSLKSSRKGKRR